MPNIQCANFCIFSGQVSSVAGAVETVDVSFRACEGVTERAENPRCWQSSRRWDGPVLARSMNPCDGHVFDSLVWNGWRQAIKMKKLFHENRLIWVVVGTALSSCPYHHPNCQSDLSQVPRSILPKGLVLSRVR